MKYIIGCILFVVPFLTYTQNWVQVGQGAYINVSTITPPQTFCVDTTNNLLYSNGYFKTASADTIFGVGVWDGVQWDSLSFGIKQNEIEELKIYNGDLFATGGFTSAGNLPAKYMAKWDGSVWDTIVPNDMANWGFGLYEYNSELHICGLFSSIDTTTSNRIARWNGTYWSNVGSPSWFTGIAETMMEYNGELYVGGSFDSPSPGILKWDGNNWSAVGGSTGFTQQAAFYSPIECFELFQNNLYIAGFFQTPYPNSITYWDGTNFNPVGGGVDGVIFDMTVFNNELYVVGNFTTAGGISASNIAKWDGAKWCGFGSTFNGDVKSIEVFNNELYIGGNFTQIDGFPISGVAKWVGGNFVDSCGVVNVVEITQSSESVTVYPNPNNGLFTIDGKNIKNSIGRIFDVTGKMISEFHINNNITSIDLTSQPKGIYFVKIESANRTIRKKIIRY